MSALLASAGAGAAQAGGTTTPSAAVAAAAAAAHPAQTNTTTATTTTTKKFQKLDINSMYCVNRGESMEQVSTRSTLSRKLGMQSLGKVPSARRPPANLPSLRTETAAATAGAPPTPPTTDTNAGPPPVPMNSVPTAPVSNINPAAGWGILPPPTSAHFKQEFPSLGGDPGALGSNVAQGVGQPPINASLRPHAEGSWSSGGGGGVAGGRPGESNPAGSVPPSGAPAPTTAAYRTIIPSFMMKDAGGMGVPVAAVPPSLRAPQDHRERDRDPTNQSHRNSHHHHHRHQQQRGIEALQQRPILRTEQLNSLDDIAKDAGWAVHDTIDYNQKLSFSDDESERPPGGREGRQTEARESVRETAKDAGGRDGPKDREIINTASGPPHIPTDEDVWAARQRHQTNEIAAAVRRANQRKEDEERRYQQEHRKALNVPDWEKGKENKEYNRDSQKEQRDNRERERERDRDRDFRDGNRENRENREDRGDTRDNKDKSKESTRDAKEMRDQRDGRDARDFRESRDDVRFRSGRGEPPSGGGQGGGAPNSSGSNFNKSYQSNLPPRFLKQQLQRQEQDKENSGGNNQSQTINQSNKSPGFGDGPDNRWTFPQKGGPGGRGQSGRSAGGAASQTGAPPPAERGQQSRKQFNREFDDNSGYGSRWEVSRSGSYDWRSSAGSNPPSANLPANTNANANVGASAAPQEEWKDKETPEQHTHKTSAAERLSEVFDRKITQNKRVTPERDKVEVQPVPPPPPAPVIAPVPAPIINKSDSEDNKRNYPPKKPLPNLNVQKDKAKSVEPDSNVDNERYLYKDQRAKSQEIDLDSNKIDEAPSQERKEAVKSSSSWADATLDKSKDTSTAADGTKESDGRSERKLSSSGSEKRNGRNRLDSGGSKASSGRGYGNYTPFNNRINWTSGGGGGRRGPNNAPGGGRGGPRQGQWGPASESDNSAEEMNKDRREASHKRRSGRSPRNGRRQRDKDDKNRQQNSAPVPPLIPSSVPEVPSASTAALSSTTSGLNAQAPMIPPLITPVSSTGSVQCSVSSTTVVSGGAMAPAATTERNESAFAPRGEPSRRGRGGGYRSGGRGPQMNASATAANASSVNVPANPSSAPPATGKHRVDGYGLPSVKSPFGGQTSVDESKSSNSDAMRTDDRPDQKQQSQGGVSGGQGGRGHRGGRRSGREEDEGWENSETSERDSGAEGGNQGRGGRRRGGHGGRGPPPRSRRPEDETNKKKDELHPDRNNPEGNGEGFQEVRNKKNIKDQRNTTVQRDDAKKTNSNQRTDSSSRNSNEKSTVNGAGGKANVQPSSQPAGPQKPDCRSQSFESRPRPVNIPPRFVKQMLNKTQSFPDAPVPQMAQRGATPPPAPVANAWEKPISRTLRGDPDGDGSIAEAVAEPAAPGGESPARTSQRSAPAGEQRVCAGSLDGATPPVQTIIFENTNYKSAPDALMSKYQPGLTSPRPQPERAASSELEARLLGFDRPDLQLVEDSSDMKLDFAFDSDLTRLGDDKTAKALGLSRSMHAIQQNTISPSAAELNLKIASVKKVWETVPPLPTVAEHAVSSSNTVVPQVTSPGVGNAGELQMLHHGEYSARPHHHEVNNGVAAPAHTSTHTASTATPLSGELTVHHQTNVCKVKPTQQQAAQQQAAQQQQQQQQQQQAAAAAQQTLLAVSGGGSGVSPPPAIHYGGGVAGVVPYGGLSVPSPPSAAAAAAAAVLFNSSQYAFPLEQPRATQFNAFAPPFSSMYQPPHPPDPVYQYRLGSGVGGVGGVGGGVNNAGVGVSSVGLGVGVGGSMMLSSHSHAQQPPSTAALLQAKQQQQQQIGAIGTKAAVASAASAVNSYQYLTGFGVSGGPPSAHQPPPTAQHHQQMAAHEQYVVHRPPPTAYTAYGSAPPTAAPPPPQPPPPAPPHAPFYQQQASAYGLQYPQQQQLATTQFLAAAAAAGSPQSLQMAVQQMQQQQIQQQQHTLYDLSGQKFSSSGVGVGGVGVGGMGVGGGVGVGGGSGGGAGRHLQSHSLYQQQIKHQQIKSPPTHQECIFGVAPSPSPKPLGVNSGGVGVGVGVGGVCGGMPPSGIAPPHSPPHKYHHTHNMQQQNGRHLGGSQPQQGSMPQQQQRYPAPIQRPPQQYRHQVMPEGMGGGMVAPQRHHRQHHYYHQQAPPPAHVPHSQHNPVQHGNPVRHNNGDRVSVGTGVGVPELGGASSNVVGGEGGGGDSTAVAPGAVTARDGPSPAAAVETAQAAADN